MTTHDSMAGGVATNPLARLAAPVPVKLAVAISVAARLAGAGFALYYAYDQDVLFPERHFPRTWVLASVIAAVAVQVSSPWAPPPPPTPAVTRPRARPVYA